MDKSLKRKYRTEVRRRAKWASGISDLWIVFCALVGGACFTWIAQYVPDMRWDTMIELKSLLIPGLGGIGMMILVFSVRYWFRLRRARIEMYFEKCAEVDALTSRIGAFERRKDLLDQLAACLHDGSRLKNRFVDENASKQVERDSVVWLVRAGDLVGKGLGQPHLALFLKCPEYSDGPPSLSGEQIVAYNALRGGVDRLGEFLRDLTPLAFER